MINGGGQVVAGKSIKAVAAVAGASLALLSSPPALGQLAVVDATTGILPPGTRLSQGQRVAVLTTRAIEGGVQGYRLLTTEGVVGQHVASPSVAVNYREGDAFSRDYQLSFGYPVYVARHFPKPQLITNVSFVVATTAFPQQANFRLTMQSTDRNDGAWAQLGTINLSTGDAQVSVTPLPRRLGEYRGHFLVELRGLALRAEGDVLIGLEDVRRQGSQDWPLYMGYLPGYWETGERSVAVPGVVGGSQRVTVAPLAVGISGYELQSAPIVSGDAALKSKLTVVNLQRAIQGEHEYVLVDHGGQCATQRYLLSETLYSTDTEEGWVTTYAYKVPSGDSFTVFPKREGEALFMKLSFDPNDGVSLNR